MPWPRGSDAVTEGLDFGDVLGAAFRCLPCRCAAWVGLVAVGFPCPLFFLLRADVLRLTVAWVARNMHKVVVVNLPSVDDANVLKVGECFFETVPKHAKCGASAAASLAIPFDTGREVLRVALDHQLQPFRQVLLAKGEALFPIVERVEVRANIGTRSGLSWKAQCRLLVGKRSS